MDSGYPLDWFAENVPPKLLCEICGKVMQSPKQTKCCSNSFCFHCLEFWIEYYGICPKRCGEIDRETLRKDVATEKAVLALATHCKYQVYGCQTLPLLADKSKHEKKCNFRSKTDALLRPAAKIEDTQDSYVEMASVVASRKTLHPSPPDLVYHTYHLTRRVPGESLGFVLVAGAKNSNGKAVNFSIKSVTPCTVAAEVGLLPGDKIVQVDNIPLSQLQQQEAVSRIKDNPTVILTVIRGRAKKPVETGEHIYEDILYSDIPATTESADTPYRDRSESSTEMFSSSKKKSVERLIQTDADRMLRSPNVLTQKISADSGLSSSSSSTHPNSHKHHLLRTQDHTHHSYHNERELMKKYLHDRKPNIDTNQGRRVRTEGDYELEEIFLQKNGTNQLGITLGYDAKSTAGRLFVCDIISTGLAAKDGRLQKGDIIKKVNGFDVYDPEEAVLLFLEQDQDITLSVARKTKVRRRRALLGKNSQSHGSLVSAIHDGHDGIRRTDSCGSLDSHQYSENIPLSPQRRNSETSTSQYKIRYTSASPDGHTFTPPTITSSGYGTGCSTSIITTDYAFRPINETRPSSNNKIIHKSHIRSTTSLGSDPTHSLNPHPPVGYPMTRHQSIETQRFYRSPSPKQNHYKAHAMSRSVSRLRTESLV